MSASAELDAFVQARYAQVLARCRESGVVLHDDAGVAEHVQRVLVASDFAFAAFVRDARLLDAQALARMADPRHADARPLALSATVDETAAMAELRRYRHAEAVRLVWRDVNGLDSVEQTLAGSSALAEACLAAALAYADRVLARRHGTPRDAQGVAQRLVVLAMGKLGGNELNFSSDIDLILAFAENGTSDGERPLANEAYFARLGQLLVKLLAEITADGLAYRVDLRLRPFGNAGRVALSFAAMEQYYQREGRDWERYAFIKARPVAGDIAAGKRLLEALRPFVFRKYLDYTAFAGLREMKALIDADVARRDLAANLKLGPGGIREIEFVVQLLQLIRGGREASMRETGLLPALTACERLGALSAESAKRLRTAYVFLRRVENRAQMLRDEQTHDVPEDAFARLRLAATLGLPDWPALEHELAKARAGVATEFADRLGDAPVTAASAGAAPSLATAAAYWQALGRDQAGPAPLVALGFAAADNLHAALHALAAGAARIVSARGRARLDRLLPHLLQAAAASAAPDACLERLVRLLHAVLRRSAYLALLEEQPAARLRLVDVFAGSALLAERVIAHPLLLDELLGAANAGTLPDRAALDAEIGRRLAQVDAGDAEGAIEILQEEKQSAAFRIGLACRGGADAVATAHALGATAQVVVAHALRLAEDDLARAHGRLPGGVAVIGYGSLGGDELGFASDLDLVFVYDGALAQTESDGARPLEGARYFARIAQRVVHWLTTQTRAGKLYDVDVRLRPDGGKGLLVVGVQAFAEYLRERAWIWESQALVRARPIAGDARACAQFAALRAQWLGQARDRVQVLGEVGAMRARWRAERDRSTAASLDLKQGAGALLDIEFILQTLVLLNAHAYPSLLDSGNSARLIALCGHAGVLAESAAQTLAQAHAALLKRALDCTLDARPRLVPRDAELERQARAVLQIAADVGLQIA
ncbi:MAG: bifunctional [glutamate--ammonia ligase]-adenylyl-L-tyrosine phosphorylase/[glutamate--ammonia-ligase] adenylyltransferase [Proteobacteria bacterium]|nr:bifunctional [glutamate--ammonia ligase]-adenylyl-L-tyrosine phosphorylase/[glutamate--ammonia-ligase] adenylyltransferase [Pseudomonadota bacterium]